MLLAGFDAGQTTTRCRIVELVGDHWREIATGLGPGVSHLEAANGTERFQAAIRTSSANAGAIGSLDAAVIGASGIERGTPLEERASRLMARTLDLAPERALATGDERTALRGAFPEQPGIVAISGTGMICIGRNGQGVEHRCGGWGWRLDGAGAAFDLGHQGLQLSLRMADGRLPDHPLREELWNLLGCSSSEELKALVVSPAFRTAQFAALAPAVVSAAENGLKEARWIVDRSAAAQAESIHAVAVVLGLSQPQVVGQGGAFEHLLLFRNAVREALSVTLPEAQWCDPVGDACDGALNLARDLVIRPR